jgi:hypothetical protein
MSDFPDAQPHGPIEELGDDIFWVPGTMRMGPGVRISRNMAIVRSGTDLTLVNAVRLSTTGERALEELGTVKNVVKIGAFHGIDDPYSVWRFGAKYWALSQEKRGEDVLPDEALSETNSPIDDGAVFEFAGTKQREGALLVQRGAGTLITCDAVQNWPNAGTSSLAGGLIARAIGLRNRPAQIGPPWRRIMTPKGASLRSDFERLAALDFAHLVAAHGAPLRDTAKADLQATIAATFR